MGIISTMKKLLKVNKPMCAVCGRIVQNDKPHKCIVEQTAPKYYEQKGKGRYVQPMPKFRQEGNTKVHNAFCSSCQMPLPISKKKDYDYAGQYNYSTSVMSHQARCARKKPKN